MTTRKRVSSPGTQKLAFVTIGATASFDDLIRGCITPGFLSSLRQNGYTDLVIQFGKDGRDLLEAHLPTPADSEGQWVSEGIRISGYDFKKAGLMDDMLAAKGAASDLRSHAEGVVISHAGSGTILDALRVGVPLIVVPNPKLLDNHQVELAEELSAQGYLVYGKIDAPDGLRQAIADSEQLRASHTKWPPVNNRDTHQRGIATVMDEEMGFVALD